MKSLEERLENRRQEYEDLVHAEKLFESWLEKITPLFPENAHHSGNIYSRNAYLYISVDSVEDFEENILSKLSKIINATWRRSVSEHSIIHSADFDAKDKEYYIYLSVNSKPTNSCRIVAVPTGKVKKVQKTVTVEEAEIEYLIDCSEEEENANTKSTNDL